MGKYINPTISIDDEESDLVTKPDEHSDSVSQPIDEDAGDNQYAKQSEVYFAFIDVLGFSDAFNKAEAVDQATAGQSKRELADRYKDVFSYYFDLLRNSNFMFENSSVEPLCYAGQTSDSLYFYTARIDMMMEYIKIYSYFSLYAMQRGVFLRGGIAHGMLYYNAAHQFYGDSVIKAYLLESVISKNPVISIDEKTSTALRDNSPDEHNKFVYKKSNRHYINPFVYLSGEQRYSLPVSPEFKYKPEAPTIESIISIIKARMEEYEYEDKLYQKYIFLYEKCKEIMESSNNSNTTNIN